MAMAFVIVHRPFGSIRQGKLKQVTQSYIVDKVMCMVYVDDLIFWAKEEDNIHDLAMKLHELGVELEP